jgi:hypothetical protein
MLINETSRLSQLTPAGLTKLSATMAENNLLFDVLTREISETVFAMPIEEFDAAIEWYVKANEYAKYLAIRFDTTIEIAAGIISAVSPRMPWLRNMSVAAAILDKFNDYAELSALDVAKEIGLALSTNVSMAVKIARGGDVANTLTGTKRRSFYNNIVAPSEGDSVTIDTWMVRAFMRTNDSLTLKTATALLSKNETALGGTGAGYYVLSECVRNSAKEYGIKPCQIQAAYWVSVSKSMDGGRPDISQ